MVLFKTSEYRSFGVAFFAAFLICIAFVHSPAQAQEMDLLALLGEEEPRTDYTFATFKTTRIINGHSVENVGHGVLDFKISHRFGTLNRGPYDFFGLDAATIRLGFDYGLTENIMIGIGRSSYEKALDGFVKYRFLRQSTGAKNMPVTVSFSAATAVNMLRWQVPDRENYISSRFFYTFQGIVARKVSDNFSIQLMPTVVHRNLVKTRAEANDVFALGIAARQKITSRTSVNLEYYYVFPGQLADGFRNALSIGFDIETGGHVFQLHFTNATTMVEKSFIAENTSDWPSGGIHFGFNISRVFTLYRTER